MAARTTKKKVSKKKATRKKATRARQPTLVTERVVFLYPDVDIDDHIADHISGTCRHGVDKCRTCESSHRSDKVAVALVAGAVGMIIGAIAQAAEEANSPRILVLSDG